MPCPSLVDVGVVTVMLVEHTMVITEKVVSDVKYLSSAVAYCFVMVLASKTSFLAKCNMAKIKGGQEVGSGTHQISFIFFFLALPFFFFPLCVKK